MTRLSCTFIVVIAMACAAIPISAQQPAANVDAFQKKIKPLLMQHCAKCHGPKKSQAELRIDQLNPDLIHGDDAEHWEEVYNQLNIGDMPPEDQPQPTSQERELITGWLNNELRAAAAFKRSTGGNNVIRRLTRFEYNNTLRDLLGLDLDFAQDLPPEGAAEEGFVNNSAVLGTSGLHLEYFQRIAAMAIHKAISPGERPEPFVLVVEPEQFVTEDDADSAQDAPEKSRRAKKRNKNKGSGKGPIQVLDSQRAASGVLLNPSTTDRKGSKKAGESGSLIQVMLTELPQDGPIRITVRAAAANATPQAMPRLHIELGYDGGNSASPFEVLASVDISSSELTDYVFDVRGENFPLTTLNAKSRQFVKIRNTFHPGTADVPAESLPRIVIDSIKLEGHYYDQWPPETRNRILGVPDRIVDSEETSVREVLNRFMTRAYRRPAEQAEVDRMLTLFRTLRSRDANFDDAIIETLSAVLASPGFLMLAEPAPAGQSPDVPRKLNDYELASRLSYFLWSSMPDETLFELAASEMLSEPQVLTAQIERMLADSKATAFFENFTSQWMHLDGIYAVAINPEFFPDFPEELKATMNAETVAFFADLVQSNRSALQMIDSSHAMLNAELAMHYGISGVAGNSLRSVKLDPSSHRGGILTHASLLTLNSSGDDTHPIKRGVWLLERMLGDPPPPPPPAVPTLAEADDSGEQLSLKARLEAHRQQEACMTCHRKIDPWGLAFENYDGIGVWRDSTKGAEPILTASPEAAQPQPDVASNAFASQPAVAAPKIDRPEDARPRVRELIAAANETLESLQRPYNHLRRLGSDGAGDQLRRFLGYIEDREPNVETAFDKLLIESGWDRDAFMKEFRKANAEVLAANHDIRTKAEAVAPQGVVVKSNRKKRKSSADSSTLRGVVDPETVLSDGTKITDLNALKAYLLKHKRHQFSETLVRKVLGYALGRYLDFTDTETVNDLTVTFAANDFCMRDLVLEVVLSKPFLTK